MLSIEKCAGCKTQTTCDLLGQCRTNAQEQYKPPPSGDTWPHAEDADCEPIVRNEPVDTEKEKLTALMAELKTLSLKRLELQKELMLTREMYYNTLGDINELYAKG